MNKWTKYEEEKRRLLCMDLTPEEYQRKIRELAKKLKI